MPLTVTSSVIPREDIRLLCCSSSWLTDIKLFSWMFVVKPLDVSTFFLYRAWAAPSVQSIKMESCLALRKKWLRKKKVQLSSTFYSVSRPKGFQHGMLCTSRVKTRPSTVKFFRTGHLGVICVLHRMNVLNSIGLMFCLVIAYSETSCINIPLKLIVKLKAVAISCPFLDAWVATNVCKTFRDELWSSVGQQKGHFSVPSFPMVDEEGCDRHTADVQGKDSHC